MVWSRFRVWLCCVLVVCCYVVGVTSYELADPSDKGYLSSPHGYYDIQGLGVAADYCRYVGDSSKNGIWPSCALAGSNNQYTAKGAIKVQLVNNGLSPITPKPTSPVALPNDKGYSGIEPQGYYDIFGIGQAVDYCRMVGDYPGYPSCALAGTNDESTPVGAIKAVFVAVSRSCVFTDSYRPNRTIDLSMLSGNKVTHIKDGKMYSLYPCGPSTSIPFGFCSNTALTPTPTPTPIPNPSPPPSSIPFYCESTTSINNTIAYVDVTYKNITITSTSVTVTYQQSGDWCNSGYRTSIITYTCSCNANDSLALSVTQPDPCTYIAFYTSSIICPGFGICTTTTSPPTTISPPVTTDTMSTPTLIGIILGTVIACLVMALVSFLWCRRYKHTSTVTRMMEQQTSRIKQVGGDMEMDGGPIDRGTCVGAASVLVQGLLPPDPMAQPPPPPQPQPQLDSCNYADTRPSHGSDSDSDSVSDADTPTTAAPANFGAPSSRTIGAPTTIMLNSEDRQVGDDMEMEPGVEEPGGPGKRLAGEAQLLARPASYASPPSSSSPSASASASRGERHITSQEGHTTETDEWEGEMGTSVSDKTAAVILSPNASPNDDLYGSIPRSQHLYQPPIHHIQHEGPRGLPLLEPHHIPILPQAGSVHPSMSQPVPAVTALSFGAPAPLPIQSPPVGIPTTPMPGPVAPFPSIPAFDPSLSLFHAPIPLTVPSVSVPRIGPHRTPPLARLMNPLLQSHVASILPRAPISTLPPPPLPPAPLELDPALELDL